MSGKWIVKNWDGTVAGLEGGHHYNFDKIEEIDRSIPTSVSMKKLTQIEGKNKGTSNKIPFCKIGSVECLSPAERSGLKENDLITNFGSVDHSNHRNLSALSDLVLGAANEGSGVTVKAIRQVLPSSPIGEGGSNSKKEYLEFQIFPRPWSGRGLLGCHIQPV